MSEYKSCKNCEHLRVRWYENIAVPFCAMTCKVIVADYHGGYDAGACKCWKKRTGIGD